MSLDSKNTMMKIGIPFAERTNPLQGFPLNRIDLLLITLAGLRASTWFSLNLLLLSTGQACRKASEWQNTMMLLSGLEMTSLKALENGVSSAFSVPQQKSRMKSFLANAGRYKNQIAFPDAGWWLMMMMMMMMIMMMMMMYFFAHHRPH